MSTSNDTAELKWGRRVRFDNGVATEAERIYQVLRANNSAEFALSAITGLPAAGTAHPVYTSLRVVEHEPIEENARQWFVRVTYRVAEAIPGEPSTTPVTVRTSYRNSNGQRELSFDAATGAVILNSAGDAFDSVITVPTGDFEIQIVKKQNVSNLSTLIGFNGTVNSGASTVGGISVAAHKGRLTIDVSEIEDANYDYEVIYTVAIRSNIIPSGETTQDIGWREAFLQQGYRALFGSPAELKYVTVIDEQGEDVPVNKPVLLNADGGITETPVFKIVNAHLTEDWRSLPL